jgi:hypothetical protein
MDVQEPRTVVNSQKAAALSTSGRTPVPKEGDLLVSRRTARADVYAISVVPAEAQLTTVRFEEAINAAGELARRRAVDGWYTCDHTHFVPIARHRP